MELWLTESHTQGYSVNWKVKETLHVERTKFQNLAIVETYEFGRALVLDGIIQTTVNDEYIYHEMISHPALFTHPNPKKVLVIGGGDGGTVREVIRHTSVEKAVLVEIDDRVIEISKKYLPEISCALDDPRVEVIVDDGILYMEKAKKEFDVIIVDSSDPIGPAVGLFSGEFYENIYNALKDDGIFVSQTESPLFNKDLLSRVFKGISGIFPITKLYLTAVPTYIAGFWSFTMGSKKYDPLNCQIDEAKLKQMKLKYFNTDIHKGAFLLPNYVKEVIEGI